LLIASPDRVDAWCRTIATSLDVAFSFAHTAAACDIAVKRSFDFCAHEVICFVAAVRLQRRGWRSPELAVALSGGTVAVVSAFGTSCTSRTLFSSPLCRVHCRPPSGTERNIPCEGADPPFRFSCLKQSVPNFCSSPKSENDS
jgi:hypothetical protein